MARIQYRPAARGRGFSAPQLSTAGISRMREESNRLIQGMQQRRQDEMEQRNRELQAMKDDIAYTNRINEENQRIKLQNIRNEGMQRVVDAQGQARQAQIDAQATQSIIGSIVNFSTTAAKYLAEEDAKKRKEEERKFLIENPPETRTYEDLEGRSNAEFARDIGGIKLSTEIVAAAAESGEDPHETKRTLAASPAPSGRAEQVRLNLGFERNFTIFMDGRLSNNEKLFTASNGQKFTGAEARGDSYLNSELFEITKVDLMQRMGVTDPLQVADALEKISTIGTVYFNDARKEERERDDAIVLDRSRVNASDGTVRGVQVAFNDLATYFGRSEALDKIEKYASENPDSIEAFRQADLKGNGKTFEQEFPTRWERITQKVNEAIVRQSNAEENLKKAQNREWFNANVDSIQEAINQNPYQASLLIEKRYYDQGLSVPPVLTKMLSAGIERNKDLTKHTLLERTRFGILDLSFVNSIRDPQLQKQAREAFNAQEESKYGPEALGIKKGFKATARKLTKINPNEEQGSAQTFLVQARLESEYLKQLNLTNDPLKALENVNQMVDAGNANDKSSPFYMDPGLGENNRPVFPNIETSDREVAEMNTYINKQLLKNGASVVNKPFALATTNQMDATYASSLSGTIQYPPGILQAADILKLKPSELYNEHRKANNAATGENKPLLTPSPASMLLDEASPAMRKLFLSDEPMKIGRATAIATGAVSRNLRPSMGGGDFSSQRNALETAAAELGVDPIDLATIIGFETGGTYDPSEVGGEGNNYRGLIQFGEPERKAYGVVPGMSFEEQLLGPVVRFFKDRFAREGMDTQGATLEDLYTTVLAGNPRANRDAADSFGTTARSGVKRMFEEHRPAAIKRFGF